MAFQLGARVFFAAATFFWALAGSLGAAGAGWGALGALGLVLLVAFLRPAELAAAARNRYLWAVGAAFALTNASLALATDLLPLVVLALASQLSPLFVLWIAPLWGERARRDDWGLAALGLLGAILVVGGGGGASLLGLVAGAVFIVAVSVSSHFWGMAARKSDVAPAPALVFLFLPSLPFLLLSQSAAGAPFYMLGGVLFALGNGLMYMAYQRGWSVVRSVLLKPIVTLLLAAAGVLFLGDTITPALLLGGGVILLTAFLVSRRESRRQEG